MCLTRFIRTASTLGNAKPNPLLGEFAGLSFKVTAKDVEEAIPTLVKNVEKDFTDFETKLSGLSLFYSFSMLLNFQFPEILLEFFKLIIHWNSWEMGDKGRDRPVLLPA